MERRDFLKLAGASAGAAIAPEARCAADSSRRTPAIDEFESRAALAVSDSDFWNDVRGYYSLPTDHLDLDHASCAPAPTVVFDAFVQRARR